MSETETPLNRPAKRATFRLDARVQHRIQTGFVVAMVIALTLIGYRTFLNFKTQRNITIGKSNLLNLYKAMAAYAQDWDRLPPANVWTDVVRGYLHAPPNTPGGADSYLQGPADYGTVGYVYNHLAEAYNLEPTNVNDRQKDVSPSNLVLLIEKVGAEPNTGILIPSQQPGADIEKNEKVLYKNLDFPHYSEDKDAATTLILLASGRILVRTRRDFR